MPGSITASWAQRYQMDDASFDHALVEVREVGGTNPRTLFEWLDATMVSDVGSPPTTIQESSGWSLMSADISAYAGSDIEMRFHLDSDASGHLAGLAIDDVSVAWCCTAALCADGDPCTTDGCDATGCVHAPLAIPGEVAGVAFAIDKETISWSAVADAYTYDVVRGTVSALPVGPGGDDELCAGDLAAPSTTDPEVPAAGAGFWYVVRAKNTCGGGTFGGTSGGSPRTTTTCP